MTFIDLMKLILVGAIWGSSYLLMKLAVPLTGATFTTAARISVAAVAIPFIAVVRKQFPDIRTKYKYYAVLGLLNLVITYIWITWMRK
ncbi:hypothetical protein WG954_15590 [Lacibacter sp. H375]|uniref:EamA family transporter n=1 Tax=Lacibacter sp. H375 TaxID=3133424 RepID=UPI0030C0B585